MSADLFSMAVVVELISDLLYTVILKECIQGCNIFLQFCQALKNAKAKLFTTMCCRLAGNIKKKSLRCRVSMTAYGKGICLTHIRATRSVRLLPFLPSSSPFCGYVIKD